MQLWANQVRCGLSPLTKGTDLYRGQTTKKQPMGPDHKKQPLQRCWLTLPVVVASVRLCMTSHVTCPKGALSLDDTQVAVSCNSATHHFYQLKTMQRQLLSIGNIARHHDQVTYDDNAATQQAAQRLSDQAPLMTTTTIVRPAECMTHQDWQVVSGGPNQLADSSRPAS